MDVDLWQVAVPDEYVWLSLLESAIALAMTTWSFMRLRHGLWAVMSSIGAGMFLVVNGLYFVGFSLPKWFDVSTNLTGWVLDNSSPLAWGRVLGLGLFVITALFVRRPALSTVT